MYISHKYKLIFLRTPKTASSSVSDFLVKNIDDPNAIYTPIDDTRNLGKNINGYIFKKYDKFSWAHLTIENIIEEGFITEKQIKEYKIYAVIREPLDREMSLFYHYKKWGELGLEKSAQANIMQYRNLTPNGYFETVNGCKKQSYFLRYKDKIVGTYILYEELEESLSNIMKEIGLVIKQPLPRHKSDARPKSDDFSFEEEDVKRIKSYFKEDFELYNELKGK